MERKRRRPEGRIKRITAAVLAAAVLVGAPVWSAVRAEADNEGTKDKPRLTVSIQRYDSDDEAAAVAREDLSVTVDLYQIAAATDMAGYDAYNWTATEEFGGLDLNTALNNNSDQVYTFENGSTTNADYRALANEAAKIALGVTGDVKAGQAVTVGAHKTVSYTVELNAENGFRNAVPESDAVLNKGIYLLVPHGTNLTDASQYTVCVKDGEIATVAYAGGNVYRYLPELVSVPAPNETRNGWVYDVEAALKTEVSEQYVSLEIVKNVAAPEGEERLTGEDHFVYQIEAEYNGKKVYSNVVELTLPAGASSVSSESLPVYSDGKRPLHNIVPAGAKITVTEVYTGASYELAGAGSAVIESAQTDAEDGSPVNRAEFTNRYTGTDRNGGSVENRFVYNKAETEGKWNWEQKGSTGN